MSNPLEECRTVGDLIDLYCLTVRGRPPRPHNGDSEQPRLRHMEVERELEQYLCVALIRFGPVTHAGQVWWTQLPVRCGRACHAAVKNAADVPWRLNPEPPAAEPPPEKVAGHIPRKEVENA